jgi:hypothetical protein
MAIPSAYLLITAEVSTILGGGLRAGEDNRMHEQGAGDGYR